MKRSLRAAIAALLATSAIAFVAPRRAFALELQADAGAAFRRSSWRGDTIFGTQLGAGLRFAHAISLDFTGWEEYASVDQRLNTGLTFGVTGTLPSPTARPFVRLYFIHQHEEGLVSVRDHPFGTVAGIGTGIRHRAGMGTRFGVEVPFAKKKRVEWFFTAGGDVTWFPDDTIGPGFYFGASGTIGLTYDLEDPS
jgi:hypothetical protein